MLGQLMQVRSGLTLFVAIAATFMLAGNAPAWAGGTGSCFRGRFGTTIDCGGGYVIPAPAPAPAPTPPPAPAVHPVPLALYVANGPNGPCMALGPANPAPNATVTAWLATVHFPNCPPNPGPNGGPAPALTPIDPVSLAVRFWHTIPLPAPRPTIPPGYAVTGKRAYLVTNGTTAPPPYTTSTPLGTLTVSATGTYRVDWGDPYAGARSGWQGPYAAEGQPWPNGRITHTYDYTGAYDVTVEEDWTAVWHLAGAAGTLGGLHTTATIPGFRVEQLQAVITN